MTLGWRAFAFHYDSGATAGWKKSKHVISKVPRILRNRSTVGSTGAGTIPMLRLENYLVKWQVEVRLGLRWLGGLITCKSQERTNKCTTSVCSWSKVKVFEA